MERTARLIFVFWGIVGVACSPPTALAEVGTGVSVVSGALVNVSTACDAADETLAFETVLAVLLDVEVCWGGGRGGVLGWRMWRWVRRVEKSC